MMSEVPSHFLQCCYLFPKSGVWEFPVLIGSPIQQDKLGVRGSASKPPMMLFPVPWESWLQFHEGHFFLYATYTCNFSHIRYTRFPTNQPTKPRVETTSTSIFSFFFIWQRTSSHFGIVPFNKTFVAHLTLAFSDFFGWLKKTCPTQRNHQRKSAVQNVSPKNRWIDSLLLLWLRPRIQKFKSLDCRCIYCLDLADNCRKTERIFNVHSL